MHEKGLDIMSLLRCGGVQIYADGLKCVNGFDAYLFFK